MLITPYEREKHEKQIQTKLKKGVGPGGQADAGGVVGSHEVPPQRLQEAEGHGRWALARADGQAGHVP